MANPFLVSKETYLDALSVPRASLLSHFYLRSSGGGGFFFGGGGGNRILPLALETKKKATLNRVKTKREMGKDLQNLTTIDIFTTISYKP